MYTDANVLPLTGLSARQPAIFSTGRIFFGVGLLALGVEHFCYPDFVKVIIPSLPAWVPAHRAISLAVGAGLSAGALAILLNKGARLAGQMVGWALLGLLLVRHIPEQIAANAFFLAGWTNSLKVLSLASGAFLVAAAAQSASENEAVRRSDLTARMARLGRYGFALMLIVFGVDHYLYAPFVAPLVPAWIPGHLFWTYFTGAALVATGISLAVQIKDRLACQLIAAAIFIWFLVLHIPQATSDLANENNVSSAFEALAFSGIALLLASGRRAETNAAAVPRAIPSL